MNRVDKYVRMLRSGGVVVFPTDTVWGMGAAVSSKEGVEKLYRIKGRDEVKPTAVLVSDVRMANRYGVMTKKAWDLAEKYWPGGLTVVVKAKGNKVPKLVRGGGETVGLRAPNHEVAQELIKVLGEGIVAGSANFAGERPAKKKEELDKRLVDLVDGVVEGEAGGREASTVVDTTVVPMDVLRRGSVRLELI